MAMAMANAPAPPPGRVDHVESPLRVRVVTSFENPMTVTATGRVVCVLDYNKMELPVFLQPLLLIPYYQQRVAESIASWIGASNQRLFGPLEQVVAAVVIVGIAMQTPPITWDQALPDIRNLTEAVLTVSSSSSSHGTPQEAQQADLWTRLTDFLSTSPTTLITILLVMNLIDPLIPQDLRRRLKQSWDVFWPPWQDRSFSPRTVETPRSSSDRSEDAVKLPADGITQSERARAAKASSDMTSGRDRTVKKEIASSISGETKNATSKPSEAESSSAAALRAAAKEEMNTSGKVQLIAEREKKVERVTEGIQPRAEVTGFDNLPDIALSQSERAQRMKGEGIHVASDKGKQRMEGERRGPNAPALTVNPKDTLMAADAQPSEPHRSDDLKLSIIDEEDDPLMAGDYRPLRSVLRRSHSKPVQTKNIHHNYFLTMRGWRPSLIPFPHGFHPKPSGERNDLWWDNIPKNAEHIMAPPPVPKPPETEEEEKEKNLKADEKIAKKAEKDKKKAAGSQARRAEGEDIVGATSKPSSGPTSDKDKAEIAKDDKSISANGKDKAAASSDDKAREREREKQKERVKLKVATQAEAERIKIAPERQGDAKAKIIDPRTHKAVFVCQGLLCVMLYQIHHQLGFILLVYFLWQQIDSHKVAFPASTARPPTPRNEKQQPSASLNDNSTSLEQGPAPPFMKADSRKAEGSTDAINRTDRKGVVATSTPPPKGSQPLATKSVPETSPQKVREMIEILTDQRLKVRDRRKRLEENLKGDNGNGQVKAEIDKYKKRQEDIERQLAKLKSKDSTIRKPTNESRTEKEKERADHTHRPTLDPVGDKMRDKLEGGVNGQEKEEMLRDPSITRPAQESSRPSPEHQKDIPLSSSKTKVDKDDDEGSSTNALSQLRTRHFELQTRKADFRSRLEKGEDAEGNTARIKRIDDELRSVTKDMAQLIQRSKQTPVGHRSSSTSRLVVKQTRAPSKPGPHSDPQENHPTSEPSGRKVEQNEQIVAFVGPADDIVESTNVETDSRATLREALPDPSIKTTTIASSAVDPSAAHQVHKDTQSADLPFPSATDEVGTPSISSRENSIDPSTSIPSILDELRAEIQKVKDRRKELVRKAAGSGPSHYVRVQMEEARVRQLALEKQVKLF